MQQFETFKTKSKEGIVDLVETGKWQPDEVKSWGITVAASIVGALAFTTAAKAVIVPAVAIVASTPVAVIAGALGGGMLGWSYSRKRAHPDANDDEPESSMEPSLTQDEMSDVVEESNGMVEDLDKGREIGPASTISIDAEVE